MVEYPLLESLSVTMVSPGRGAVTFSPSQFSERWQIETATVVASSALLQPRASFYRTANELASGLINGTYAGAFDTDTSFNYTLYPGSVLYVVWTGGDVGAMATCILTGRRIIER